MYHFLYALWHFFLCPCFQEHSIYFFARSVRSNLLKSHRYSSSNISFDLPNILHISGQKEECGLNVFHTDLVCHKSLHRPLLSSCIGLPTLQWSSDSFYMDLIQDQLSRCWYPQLYFKVTIYKTWEKDVTCCLLSRAERILFHCTIPVDMCLDFLYF